MEIQTVFINSPAEYHVQTKCTVTYDFMHPAAKFLFALTIRYLTQRLRWPHEHRNWTKKSGTKMHGSSNPVFWYITSTGRPNTPIFNLNSGSWMHSWSLTRLLWLYYDVSEVFMRHIRTHAPHSTILDSVRYLNIDADQLNTFMTTMFPVAYFIY